MKRILYIEDDKINQLIMGKYLQSLYDVTMASSSHKAIESMGDVDFDLVLLDINLGPDELNGIELLARFKKEPKFSDLPFMAISAYTDEDDIKQLLNAGFDHFHPKPFERKKLMTQIKDILDHSTMTS